jgi:hypothetical protein
MPAGFTMARRPKTSTFRELMKDPNKKADETGHVLAKLFRDIIASQGMEAGGFDNLMDKYYKKKYTNRHGEVDMIKVNQEKSNLTRALAKDSLPWYRFETVLQILGPKVYSVTIGMEASSGHTYSHTVRVPNRFAILPPTPVEGEDEEEGK